MSDHAKQNAQAHAETIEALYELQCFDGSCDSAGNLTAEAAEIATKLGWGETITSVDDLREAVEERAREIPLSVLVRSDWHAPGDESEAGSGEFEILLSTGGPACRITGCLYQGEPSYRAGERPDIQWQDWGEPWTVAPYRVCLDALQWFCELLYYGG